MPSLAFNQEKNGRILRGCMRSADWTVSSHATVERGEGGGPETTSLWVLRSGKARGTPLRSCRWEERKSGRDPEPYYCKRRSTCQGCTHQAEYRREMTLWRDWRPWALTSLKGCFIGAGGDGKTCEVKGTYPKEPPCSWGHYVSVRVFLRACGPMPVCPLQSPERSVCVWHHRGWDGLQETSQALREGWKILGILRNLMSAPWTKLWSRMALENL